MLAPDSGVCPAVAACGVIKECYWGIVPEWARSCTLACEVAQGILVFDGIFFPQAMVRQSPHERRALRRTQDATGLATVERPCEVAAPLRGRVM